MFHLFILLKPLILSPPMINIDVCMVRSRVTMYTKCQKLVKNLYISWLLYIDNFRNDISNHHISYVIPDMLAKNFGISTSVS